MDFVSAGALVQWLWETTHLREVSGFESQHRILDGHGIFHIDLFRKICIVCLKRPKINEKRLGLPFLKTDFVTFQSYKHAMIMIYPQRVALIRNKYLPIISGTTYCNIDLLVGTYHSIFKNCHWSRVPKIVMPSFPHTYLL